MNEKTKISILNQKVIALSACAILAGMVVMGTANIGAAFAHEAEAHTILATSVQQRTSENSQETTSNNDSSDSANNSSTTKVTVYHTLCAECLAVLDSEEEIEQHKAETGHCSWIPNVPEEKEVDTEDNTDTSTETKNNALYRLYNPTTSEHLFTSSKYEYETLVNHGWQQEGTDCETPKTSSVGVYRLYNPALGGMMKMSHHYTSDKGEADNLVANWGWQYDNNGEPIFYSAQDSSGSALSDTLAVHRLYNGGLSAHHFTLTQDEKTNLETNWGWTSENIGFYAYEHNWISESKTVHHDAVTKIVPVEAHEAFTTCNVCGEHIDGQTATHGKQHVFAGEGSGWHTEYENTTKWIKIVEQEAYDEVISASCTDCGATK